MRRLIVLTALFGLTLGLKAQQDRVLLKNGSLLQGTITKIEQSRLTIDIGHGLPLSLDIDGVRSFRIKERKTSLSQESLLLADSLKRVMFEPGFYHQVRVGVLNGKDESTSTDFANLSVDYAFFYDTGQRFHLGLGLGMDQHPFFQTFPLSLELRKDFSYSFSPLYIFGKLGYARARTKDDNFGQFEKINGQHLVAVGVGYQLPVGKNALNLNVAFRNQRVITGWESPTFRSETEWNLRRLELKLGFVF